VSFVAIMGISRSGEKFALCVSFWGVVPKKLMPITREGKGRRLRTPNWSRTECEWGTRRTRRAAAEKYGRVQYLLAQRGGGRQEFFEEAVHAEEEIDKRGGGGGGGGRDGRLDLAPAALAARLPVFARAPRLRKRSGGRRRRQEIFGGCGGARSV